MDDPYAVYKQYAGGGFQGEDYYVGGRAGGHNGSPAKGWGGFVKGLGKTAADLSKKGLKAAQVCGALGLAGGE